MDAKSFIRQSPLCTSQKYTRLRAIVDKVLSGALTDEDVTKFVDAIAPLDLADRVEDSGEPFDHQKEPSEIAIPDDADGLAISAIREIQQVCNIGLIAEAPPIKLSPGLTVFYGYNASGKTSLYKAIANCLGVASHEVANVNTAVLKPARVQLLVEDAGANAVELVWPSKNIREGRTVKCFDSAVSLSLVRDPQENTFSLVHLKQEYFALLAEAFADLASQLDARRQYIGKRRIEIEKAIGTGTPELVSVIGSLSEEHLENASISDEERKHLGDLQAKLTKLENEDLHAKITAFANDISRIDQILESVATRQICEEDAQSTWRLRYDVTYFQGLEGSLRNLSECNKVLDSRAAALQDRLPSSWPGDPLWMRFVNAALEFVQSLELAEQSQYREQQCPYCQQTLSSESRKLLACYETFRGETKTRRDAAEASLTDALRDIESAIAKVTTIPSIQHLMTAETQAADKEGTFDLSCLHRTLSQILQSLIAKSSCAPQREELENIVAVYDHYLNLRQLSLWRKESYEALAKNKEGELEGLRRQIALLNQGQMLVDNRELLRSYVAYRKMVVDLADVRTLITDAKRQISTSATEFSNQVTVREFEAVLDQEYKNLGFEKPAKYRLTSRTSGTTTKRVYSIGDRAFHEILSEGEQKQHALADFLAQMSLEGYSGVVILDDPVTSLDERNIARVARRVVDCARQAGNQVLLFTHNVFFLNSLIEITGEEKVMQMSKTGEEVVIHPEVKLGTSSFLKQSKQHIESKLEEIALQDDPPELVVRNVYDLLSNYIETAVEVNLFKEVVGRYRPNIRIQSLRKISWDDSTVQTLVELHNRTSRKGIRHSQPLPVPPPTAKELHEDAEEIFNLIRAL